MIDSSTTSHIDDSGGIHLNVQPRKQTPKCVRPCILLTGLRRSGKTSIQRVIFTKMQPSQTQFLESTPRLTVHQFSCGSFINFQVQEIPGQLQLCSSSNNNGRTANGQTHDLSYDDNSMTNLNNNAYDLEKILICCHAVVYIIDAQDDYSESITRLNGIIKVGRKVNPRIRYEVFIHKVDQLSEEAKIETQRDIHNQVHNQSGDQISGIDHWSPNSSVPNSNSQDILINFHLTSIFDHSIFEAFSKVIQKLIPQFSNLERLLNYLLVTSNIEQAFLFDIQTKISIATDSSPTDMQMYELCCDMIDLLINMSEIYGQPANGTNSVRSTLYDDDDEEENEDEYIDEIGEHVHEDDSEWNMTSQHEHYEDNPILVSDSRTSSCVDSLLDTGNIMDHSQGSLIETTNQPASAVFDSMSSSVIKLSGGRALYLKEINRHLALICILREEALTKQALIDYNVRQLKKSIIKLFRLNPPLSRASEPSMNLLS